MRLKHILLFSLLYKTAIIAAAITILLILPQTTYAQDAQEYFRRGNTHFNNNDFDSAIKEYTEAIRLNPNYAEAYYNRGIIYGQLDDYARAISDFNEVIRLEPNNIEAYFSRGNIYAYSGDIFSALADWVFVLRLNPNHQAARDNLYKAMQVSEM